jgi:cAMP-dependent protein kinase regulator
MLASNFMFENLSPIQKSQIYKVMKLRDVMSGETIIREGDQGDEMYVIDKGQFNVFKRDANGQEQQVWVI